MAQRAGEQQQLGEKCTRPPSGATAARLRPSAAAHHPPPTPAPTPSLCQPAQICCLSGLTRDCGMLGILEFAPLYILSTYFALKFGLGWAAALCSSGRRGGPAVPELCAARRVFARRLSAAATARAAPTPLRQLLTAPPSTWRTSTARAGSVASLHSPRLGGLGRVSGGRQGPVCSVRFHVEWGRLLASQWRGRALHCRGGRLPPLQSRTTALQARRGRRREGGRRRAAAWRSHAAAFCPQPRLPKLQTAHCKATAWIKYRLQLQIQIQMQRQIQTYVQTNTGL